MVNLFDILPGEFFILILRFFPIPPWFISGLVEIGQSLIKYPHLIIIMYPVAVIVVIKA